tara:strand:+ start:213 stop:1403 length:1191 start_codon:yes stop_codon:yes gene_type:complete
MSKPLLDGSTSGVKEAFRKKTLFNILTTSNYNNLIDFNFAEKQLYGRVNRLYSPIVNNESLFDLVSLPSTSDRNIVAYNFVVHAFLQLQNKFKIKLQKAEISAKETFLSDLVAFDGYQNPEGIYESYTQTYSEAMKEIAREEKIFFNDFEEFLDKMIPFIENTIKSGKPFTFPAFIKDKKCPINVSGLVIEIGNIDPSNDMDKYKEFYSSPNWEFYLNACNTYGFMVDANNPQRLVADIGSPTMLEYMKLFNSTIVSTTDFLNRSYDLVGSSYFEIFKFFLFNIYNNSRRIKRVKLTENLNDGSKIEIINTVSLTFAQFVKKYGNLYFLKLYIKTRFLEEESKFTEYEKNSIINETLELAKFDILLAVDSFEVIVNQTFDYSGSLSYITHRVKKMK